MTPQRQRHKAAADIVRACWRAWEQAHDRGEDQAEFYAFRRAVHAFDRECDAYQAHLSHVRHIASYRARRRRAR
jgi:hypothetical protein